MLGGVTMTAGYLEKLKLDMIGLPYKKAYESAVAMLESLSGGG